MSGTSPDIHDDLPGTLHHLLVSRSDDLKLHNQSWAAIHSHLREIIKSERERNRQLLEEKKALHEKFDRIVTNDHRLPDDPSIVYSHKIGQIAEALELSVYELGLLLGHRGLKWAEHPDYQTVVHRRRPSQQRFWVHDMPQRVGAVLNQNDPDGRGITDKAVLAIFRKWQHTQLAGTSHGRQQEAV